MRKSQFSKFYSMQLIFLLGNLKAIVATIVVKPTDCFVEILSHSQSTRSSIDVFGLFSIVPV